MKTPFKKFMETQRHKIDIDKWCEGIKINNDPGIDYVFNWINHNAIIFKKGWEESVCKNCYKWNDCGFKLLTDCENYAEME